jgi:hypothetical protein
MNIIEDKENKIINVSFDNFSEVAEFIATKQPDIEYYSETYRNPGFCDTTYHQAVKYMLNGWPEGIKRIDAMASQISEKIEVDKWHEGIQMDVVGDYIDMGQAIAGQPECFGRIELLPSEQKEILIIISVAYSCFIAENSIYNRGAAIVSLIETLRRKHRVVIQLNQRVEHSGPGASYGKKSPGVYTIDLTFNMDATKEFSRDLLAFYCANSAFLRRIIFKIEELLLETGKCGGNYGGPRGVYNPPKHAIVIDNMGNNYRQFDTMESSIQYIHNILKAYKERK